VSRGARSLFGLTLALVLLVTLGSAAIADEGVKSPEQPVPPSLEAFAFMGPSLVAGDPAMPDATESFRRVGIYGGLGVAFRSRYFLDPFLSVGYGTLASGDTALSDGAWGEGGTLSQRLDIWLISPGVTADLFRFRLRLGLGFAIVVQQYGFGGEETTTTQVPLAGQVGIGFNVLSNQRFRLDVESTFVHVAGADITFGVLGVTARGDLLIFR
jgi:hypothetical protein